MATGKHWGARRQTLADIPPRDKCQSVGDAIRYWRVKRGLTQQELADAVGAYVSQVGMWERGARGHTIPGGPPQGDEWLIRLARALGVSVAELMRPLGPE
jgi:transcriptional regulator with XRE-family HTH domain